MAGIDSNRGSGRRRLITMADGLDQEEGLVTEDRSVVFRVRALAQAHPFTPDAMRYLNKVVARERVAQPQAEIGLWAGNGLTVGYCLRKTEEVDASGEVADHYPISFEEADRAASVTAAAIRTSGAEEVFMTSESEAIAILDELIAGEIERRLDHWKGTVSDETWSELEEYIAWWVIKGYALRVVETTPDGQRL